MRAPNPGSEAALVFGCRCSVIDNHHGKGWRGGNGLPWDRGGTYLVSPACNLHGEKEQSDEERS